ncbi:MAG: cysteine synthase family protein [Candidatus Thermoplasmatota archaeon]|nr:cysteine synthase family protein [Candidatus Thermoplasmatota archaeon]MCL5731425.1 cysteine synthase family protein [Candidatus Thermoplasmatota archaeon]
MDSYDREFQSIAHLAKEMGIGGTPLIEVYNSGVTRILAKLEYHNRFGSVKDRPAFFMINSMIMRGVLKRDMEIIEASSGNTGIAIAYISRLLGYRATILVPASSSIETRRLLKDSAQTVIEVEDENSRAGRINIDGALKALSETMKEHPGRYVNLDQYSNPANFLSHYYTTGPEIIAAAGGIDCFVAGIGTGGTISGIGRYLKDLDWRIRVIAAEPTSDHHIQGLKNLSVSSTPGILKMNMGIIDEWIHVNDKMAQDGVRELIRKGFEVGLSSGANYMAAKMIAEREKFKTIVTVFPDGSGKYMSLYRKLGILKD